MSIQYLHITLIDFKFFETDSLMRGKVKCNERAITSVSVRRIFDSSLMIKEYLEFTLLIFLDFL